MSQPAQVNMEGWKQVLKQHFTQIMSWNRYDPLRKEETMEGERIGEIGEVVGIWKEWRVRKLWLRCIV